MVESLKSEHVELAPKLLEIENRADADLPSALKLLDEVKPDILRHAVIEEARIVRIIVQEDKPNSSESIHVFQEHRFVFDFLEHKLNKLNSESQSKAADDIHEFVKKLREHFREEEEVAFPEALRAYEKSTKSDSKIEDN